MFPKNSGTPISSILIGFSIINHPFWGTPIFGNTHILIEFFQTPIHWFSHARPRAWRPGSSPPGADRSRCRHRCPRKHLKHRCRVGLVKPPEIWRWLMATLDRGSIQMDTTKQGGFYGNNFHTFRIASRCSIFMYYFCSTLAFTELKASKVSTQKYRHRILPLLQQGMSNAPIFMLVNSSKSRDEPAS